MRITNSSTEELRARRASSTQSTENIESLSKSTANDIHKELMKLIGREDTVAGMYNMFLHGGRAALDKLAEEAAHKLGKAFGGSKEYQLYLDALKEHDANVVKAYAKFQEVEQYDDRATVTPFTSSVFMMSLVLLVIFFVGTVVLNFATIHATVIYWMAVTFVVFYILFLVIIYKVHRTSGCQQA